jgi:hypothetical protein
MRFVRIVIAGRKTAMTTSADMAAIPHADDSSKPYKAGMNGTSAFGQVRSSYAGFALRT